ncbi:MAG: OsmC family peroxiredoxin [Deltaproteobacteria bacterium]|nr:OsmC family peroxiredoxin [Deltaproteobacteria bacterium]
MPISKASARWDGPFKEGKGTMRPANGGEIAYTAGTRFEGVKGSNPEELIGAALAGCFSMALSLALVKAGAAPKSIETTADVKLEKQDIGFTITGIELKCDARVDGVDAAKFQEIALATKKGCPVSRALAVEVTLHATLAS